jgi:hypothetical protein
VSVGEREGRDVGEIGAGGFGFRKVRRSVGGRV